MKIFHTTRAKFDNSAQLTKNNSNFSKFKIKIFEDENLELRDQLSAALENQTTKSIGSFGSDDFRPNDHHHHHEKVCQIVYESYCPNSYIFSRFQ